MTSKQQALYWREWSRVRKADPAADRHALHAQALGRDKSSKSFDNADLDKVLGVFRAITQPANLNGQLRQIHQPKTRYLWKIVRDQAACIGVYIDHADAYIARILQDKFNVHHLDDLSADSPGIDEDGDPLPSQLEMMRNTLAARLSKLRRASGDTVAEMRERAGLSPRRQPAPEPSDFNPTDREAVEALAMSEDPF